MTSRRIIEAHRDSGEDLLARYPSDLDAVSKRSSYTTGITSTQNTSYLCTATKPVKACRAERVDRAR